MLFFVISEHINKLLNARHHLLNVLQKKYIYVRSQGSSDNNFFLKNITYFKSFFALIQLVLLTLLKFITSVLSKVLTRSIQVTYSIRIYFTYFLLVFDYSSTMAGITLKYSKKVIKLVFSITIIVVGLIFSQIQPRRNNNFLLLIKKQSKMIFGNQIKWDFSHLPEVLAYYKNNLNFV